VVLLIVFLFILRYNVIRENVILENTMKKFAKSAMIALAVSLSTLTMTNTAMAGNSRQFTSTLQVPSEPVRINVTLGDDLAFRADNLSTNLNDKFKSRSINDGFAKNGFFGQKDLDRLTKRLKTKMEARLEKNGIAISDDATTVLNLIITDARPNRPTFNQMSRNVSLSSSSFGLGGAKFEGSLVNASGEQGNVSYGWYETDIRYTQFGTWSDADRAIDKFTRKTAKSLK
jgi:hypothetical protein